MALQILHNHIKPATHSTRNDKLNERRLCPPISLKLWYRQTKRISHFPSINSLLQRWRACLYPLQRVNNLMKLTIHGISRFIIQGPVPSLRRYGRLALCCRYAMWHCVSRVFHRYAAGRAQLKRRWKQTENNEYSHCESPTTLTLSKNKGPPTYSFYPIKYSKSRHKYLYFIYLDINFF